MKRRPAKRRAKIKMSQPYPAIEVVSASVGVWHGSIARLRVQLDRDGPGFQSARHQRRLGGVYERSKYDPRSFPGA